MTPASWTLRCSACDTAAERDRASVCGACAQPLFAHFAPVPKGTPLADRWDAWRYAPFMPLEAGEVPVSLGEGLTPMIEAPSLAAAISCVCKQK
mgnify:FL=1